MNEQEQREAIAEACGKSQLYAVMKGGYYYRPNAHGYTTDMSQAWHTTKQTAESELVSGEPMSIVPVPPPDYLHDWNATHQMVNSLSEVCRGRWLITLDALTDSTEWLPDRIMKAPQSKWCEAFLRVNGLWKD